MICGKIIKKCLFVIALLSIIASVPALWWAWKYYQLPEFPDRRNYKTIEERAGRASDFAHRHNMEFHQVHQGSLFGTSIRRRLLQVRMLCMGLAVGARMSVQGSVTSPVVSVQL